MIRILVVDDHILVRDSLCRLLDGEIDMEVVGKASTGHKAVSLCRSEHPDVVLLDYSLPDIDGLETTQQIIALGGDSRVLVLTMHSNEEYATRLIRIGASGFVVKAASTDELLVAIRKVAQRGIYISPDIQEKMIARIGQPAEVAPEAALSNRELQVLLLLAKGSTTREAAKSLGIAVSTVETHRSRMLDKLNLRNNSDLTRFAIRRKLVGFD
jgi:DNA-binding NarL/FixJ family response regulator